MTIAGFVGADPAGLVGLAETAQQYASRIALARHQAITIVRRNGGSSEPSNTVLSRVESDLNERARGLLWRAATIAEAERAGMTPLGHAGIQMRRLAEFAALAVFEGGRWQEAFSAWSRPPSNAELLTMDPTEVAAVFAALAPEVAEDLARRRPLVIGSLDGVPAELRYLANDILVQAEIARLNRLISTLRDPGSDRFTILTLAEPVIVTLTERVAEYRRWLDEDRQILLFDPDGDGEVVEVFGDLAAASRVGVVVPGMSNSMDNFSTADGGFRQNALSLFNGSSGDIATIAWLGYDSPDSVGAATRIAAQEGAPHLVNFLEGIDPGGDKSVTVVAHSYGSVLAGLAARTGVAVNNLVFVGSPGTTLDHAADASLRPGGQVWVALADDDPIAWGIAPSELLAWSLVPDPIGYLMGIFAAIDRADHLWHGVNPVSDEFGALRFATEGSSGHSSYFESGSLDNLLLILDGDYSDVDVIDS